MTVSVLFCVLSLVTLAAVQAVGKAPPSCDECKLEPLGCYIDTKAKRAMPEEILNERDTTSKVYGGQLIDWDNYETWLQAFACRCAKRAVVKGYSVIGLQFFGECWSGPNAHETYQQHGASTECINGKFEALARDTKCTNHMGRGVVNYVYKIGVQGCSALDIEPVGCYHDNRNPRVLPRYIMNERDPTHAGYNGHLIQWGNWKNYSPQLICRCADAAKSRGDDYFAIQFWGECWSGKDNEVNAAHFIYSDQCANESFKPCKCNSFNCVGQANTNFIYKFKKPCKK